jgi:hypothetical protein
MQISNTSKLAAVVAASVLALSTSVYAGNDKGGKNDHGIENGCAVGNDAPVGTSCTTK